MTRRLPATNRVRVVVDRADAATCAMRVGDWFEVEGSRLRLPDDGAFCPHAMAAVFPVLALRQGEHDADGWLARKPWIACPDAREHVVMRLDRIEPEGSQ